MGDNSCFLLGFQIEAPECEIQSERFTNLAPLVDLFRRAHSHSSGRSAFISYSQRHGPIQLQGARISQLFLCARGLMSRDPKVESIFLTVSKSPLMCLIYL